MSSQADYQFRSRIERAFEQRIYLIEARYSNKAEIILNENNNEINQQHNSFKFEVMGNSGTAYDIAITEGKEIFCGCPDHKHSYNLCKHLLFVLIRVLGMTREQVFNEYYVPLITKNNPFKTSENTIKKCVIYMDKKETQHLEAAETVDTQGKREIDEEDSCPICLEDFGKEKLVWCKAQCKNYIHASCFSKWVKKKEDATCVYCRAKWIY